jgi:3-phosphoglycerate kinase
MPIRTLDHLVARGKRVLLRADLNVPVKDGRITDLTRLQRLCPTIRELSGKKVHGSLSAATSVDRMASVCRRYHCDRWRAHSRERWV